MTKYSIYCTGKISGRAIQRKHLSSNSCSSDILRIALSLILLVQ